MTSKAQIIAKELKQLLSGKLGNDLKEVILFGSQAYGGANKYSDYDFLIILKNTPDWKTRDEIQGYCYDLDLKYEIFLDVHILGEEELQKLRGKQPIFQTAIKKGIRA